MAKGAPSTAPTRQRVLNYLTPRVQDSLFFEEYDKSRSNHPVFGTPHPRTLEFPNHKLCYLEPTDASGDYFRWWYIAERESQDTYNWEFTRADIGGTKFNAVTRTYVTLRSKFTPATPAAGATMPDVPRSMFTGTYVLAERKEIRTNDPKVDSLFVIDQQTYIQKTVQTQLDFDEQFGGILPTTQTLYYSTEIVTGILTAAELFAAPTNAYWGMQSTGVFRDGKQLSTDWYVITERRVIAQAMIDTGRTYTTAMDYQWPGVLASVAVDDWPRREGGSDMFARPVWTHEAYRGPCKAVVTETFHTSAPTPTQPNVMKPLPISISTPVFSFNIGPVLHGTLTIAITSGTNHQVYEYTGGNFGQAATTPTTWPASILASDEVRPFRGGFLRTSVTIYPPAYTP